MITVAAFWHFTLCGMVNSYGRSGEAYCPICNCNTLFRLLDTEEGDSTFRNYSASFKVLAALLLKIQVF